MTQKLSNKIQIELPSDILAKAKTRAHALGMTLSEYVQFLVDKDAPSKALDPWLEPIPKEVDEQWEREIAEFDEQERTNPRPGARTADELIQLLDEEAAQLSDDEGN